MTIKGFERIEEIRSDWEKLQRHPYSDIGFYSEFCRAHDGVIYPYIVVLSRDGQVEAIAVARLEELRFAMQIGYKVIWNPKVNSLTVLYKGILGSDSDENCEVILSEMMKSLATKEADMLWFNHLPLDSNMYRIARSHGKLQKWVYPKSAMHWLATLPESYEEYVASRKKHFRANFKKAQNRIRKHFRENAMVEEIRSSGEIDRLFKDTEIIAIRTYHRGLIDAGFRDSPEMRSRVTLAMKRGLFRGYILYLGGRPEAFVHGGIYGDTFYPWATGYNPESEFYSPGVVVMMNMIEHLCKEKTIKAVDFGFGDAGYKQNFCDRKWEESSVHIFSRNGFGILLNVIWVASNVVSKMGKEILEWGGNVQKVKKVWRNRLRGKDAP